MEDRKGRGRKRMRSASMDAEDDEEVRGAEELDGEVHGVRGAEEGQEVPGAEEVQEQRGAEELDEEAHGVRGAEEGQEVPGAEEGQEPRGVEEVQRVKGAKEDEELRGMRGAEGLDDEVHHAEDDRSMRQPLAIITGDNEGLQGEEELVGEASNGELLLTEENAIQKLCAAKSHKDSSEDAEDAPKEDVKVTGIIRSIVTSTTPYLPEGVIWAIIKRLRPCSADFVPLRRANKLWNLLIKKKMSEIPMEFPRLLLPSSTEILFHSTTACELTEDPGVQCEWQQLRVPEDVTNSRICGSSDGGWLALSMENPYRIVFFNINTRAIIPMPTTIDLSYQYKETPLLRVKAMVGSWLSPTAVDVVAAIVETDLAGETIALWRSPLPHWQDVVCPIDMYDSLQDVLYFKNGFYFLTLREKLGIVKPEIETDGMVWGNWEEVPIRVMQYDDIYARNGKMLTRRYLLESKGQLFSVSKLINEESDSHRTLKLLVSRLRKDIPSSSTGSSSSSDDDQQYHNSEDDKDFEEEEGQEEAAFQLNISSNSKEDMQPQNCEDESNSEEDQVEASQANESDMSSDSDKQHGHHMQEEAEEEEEEDEEEEDEEEDEEEVPTQSFWWTDASWLYEVQDRVFFIGQAFSRSFARQSREARIYFYDDDWFKCRDTGEYLRENMGFVSMHAMMKTETPVRRPMVGWEYPLPKPTSDKFPPGWWIP